MYRREHSALLLCHYVFPVPTRKTTMAASKSFSSVASGIWNALPNNLSSAPTLPVFRRALRHHLFLLAYPDSSAKSGMIMPALSHFVIQCQLLPSHSPQTPCRPSKCVSSERLRLVKRFISHRLHTGAWGNLVLLTYTYLLTYLLNIVSLEFVFVIGFSIDQETVN